MSAWYIVASRVTTDNKTREKVSRQLPAFILPASLGITEEAEALKVAADMLGGPRGSRFTVEIHAGACALPEDVTLRHL